MNPDVILVFAYFLAWVVSFVIRYKKTRRFDAVAFIMLTYIIYAFFSFQLIRTTTDFSNLNLFPFLYLFIMLYIGMMPIIRFSNSEGPIRQPSIISINTISIIFIVSTLFYFPESVSNMAQGFTMLMSDSSYGMDMYNESMEGAMDAGKGITNLASIISGAFTQIGLLLTIYYMTLPKGNKWILIGLFVASFMKMTGGISMGQRGTIVEPLLVLIATYFLLNRFIIPKYKKPIRIAGVVIISFLFISVLLITFSRFENRNSSMDSRSSTYYYLGHANLTFNQYALDDNGIRYGDRIVPIFKKLMGFPNVPDNFMERRAKYPLLKVNDEVFITYVGDIAIDFGPIVATIIIVLFSFLFSNSIRTKNGMYDFNQLLLVHFILYLCVIGGVKLFPYSDVGGNLKIITFILTYLFFKFSRVTNNS